MCYDDGSAPIMAWFREQRRTYATLQCRAGFVFVSASSRFRTELVDPSDLIDVSRAAGDPATQEPLHAYSILDATRDTAFDRIVFTAAQMFRVPIAVVALLDGDRLCLKAQVGLDLTEIPATIALCNAITEHAVVAVEDVSIDARFAQSASMTGRPHVRFYACAPLIMPDGVRVGSLCVADRLPKTLLTRQVWQLSQLAQGVVAILEARQPV